MLSLFFYFTFVCLCELYCKSKSMKQRRTCQHWWLDRRECFVKMMLKCLLLLGHPTDLKHSSTFQSKEVCFFPRSQFKQAVTHVTQPSWACQVKSALSEPLVRVTVNGFHNSSIMRTMTESSIRCQDVITDWWRIVNNVELLPKQVLLTWRFTVKPRLQSQRNTEFFFLVIAVQCWVVPQPCTTNIRVCL